MISNLVTSDKWEDFELIDSGNGLRLERWGSVTLVRPDPQAIWKKSHNLLWSNPDALYIRSTTGGGKWEFYKNLPESWNISYKDIRLKVRPTGFKHTGLFPEQAANWDWIEEQTKRLQVKETLNLFGYTGGATIAAALAGSTVCHVDSSKGSVNWCKENSQLSKVSDGKIRLIVDDCLKFIGREFKRKKSYDAIIMDPPTFGRGKNGEVWKLQENLWELLKSCKSILSKKPAYILINSYTSSLSPLALNNIVIDIFGNLLTKEGSIKSGEIGLPFNKDKGRIMPCGIYCRVLF